MDSQRALEILDHLYDGVYVTDLSRRIVYWNHAAEELTGYSAVETVARSCGESLLNHCDREGTCLCSGSCPLSRTLRDGQQREARLYLRHRDGRRVPIHVRVAPLYDAEGGIAGAVEIFGDDSARLVQQAKIRELASQAVLDAVSGLPNRRYLEGRLQARLGELGRQRTPLAIFLADVDGLTGLNARFGQNGGDAALRVVGQTLASAMWNVEAVGRWGDDAFLGIFTPVASRGLEVSGRRLAAVCAETGLPTPEGLEKLSVSIGLAEADTLDDVSRLLGKASQALLKARREGGRRAAVYSEMPAVQLSV